MLHAKALADLYLLADLDTKPMDQLMFSNVPTAREDLDTAGTIPDWGGTKQKMAWIVRGGEVSGWIQNGIEFSAKNHPFSTPRLGVRILSRSSWI
ncbi:MAG: hypothetical protein V3T99_00490 [Nitrososphaerales archaeon]